jgi:hypothetical protein
MSNEITICEPTKPSLEITPYNDSNEKDQNLEQSADADAMLQYWQWPKKPIDHLLLKACAACPRLVPAAAAS